MGKGEDGEDEGELTIVAQLVGVDLPRDALPRRIGNDDAPDLEAVLLGLGEEVLPQGLIQLLLIVSLTPLQNTYALSVSAHRTCHLDTISAIPGSIPRDI